jgi:hypothetical protein
MLRKDVSATLRVGDAIANQIKEDRTQVLNTSGLTPGQAYDLAIKMAERLVRDCPYQQVSQGLRAYSQGSKSSRG